MPAIAEPVFAARFELVERSAHGADTERMRIIGFDQHAWGKCCIRPKDNRFIHNRMTSADTLSASPQ